MTVHISKNPQKMIKNNSKIIYYNIYFFYEFIEEASGFIFWKHSFILPNVRFVC